MIDRDFCEVIFVFRKVLAAGDILFGNIAFAVRGMVTPIQGVQPARN
jgi:hypothetical protein